MKTINETRKQLVTKDTRNLAVWTGAWTVTMAIANFGPRFLWDQHEGLTIAAIIVNVLFGAGMILANIRHLKVLDEMQRKVAMDAMGISLGVAVVLGLAYSNLDVTNIISYDAEISHLVILIGLSYIASTIVGNLRYK
jgi:hypothetical protein